MTILDTNVVSEVLKPSPSQNVLHWLADQAISSIFLTTITQAELLSCAERLPAGQRKTKLSTALEGVLGEFRGRLLPFEEASARLFPKIVGRRQSAGRPISQFDAMIASIALAAGASLATRDTEGFAGYGLELINPWTA